MMQGVRTLVRTGLLLVALLAPLGACLLKVWVHQDTIRLGYALSVAVQARDALTEERRRLQVELAAERAPANLMRLAARLGLAVPAPERLWGAP